MASKKISELDAGSALDGTETIPLVQGGGTVRALISAIKTYLNGIANTWTAAAAFTSTVTAGGNTVASIIEDSFIGTLTGMSGATTGTVSYRIFANAAGTGKTCRLYISPAITGTSNTNALTMTGLPAVCQPTGTRSVLCALSDATTTVAGLAVLSSASGTIVFGMGAGFSGTGFTNSGTKGLSAGWTVDYAL